jgi:hypothetical protein
MMVVCDVGYMVMEIWIRKLLGGSGDDVTMTGRYSGFLYFQRNMDLWSKHENNDSLFLVYCIFFLYYSTVVRACTAIGCLRSFSIELTVVSGTYNAIRDKVVEGNLVPVLPVESKLERVP